MALGGKPLIRAFHPFLPEVSAAHSAGADTWQALTLTFTPSFDGEVDVFVANRDSNKYAWFSDPVVA